MLCLVCLLVVDLSQAAHIRLRRGISPFCLDNPVFYSFRGHARTSERGRKINIKQKARPNTEPFHFWPGRKCWPSRSCPGSCNSVLYQSGLQSMQGKQKSKCKVFFSFLCSQNDFFLILELTPLSNPMLMSISIRLLFKKTHQPPAMLPPPLAPPQKPLPPTPPLPPQPTLNHGHH